jgi:nitrous oxidase accessory protein
MTGKTGYVLIWLSVALVSVTAVTVDAVTLTVDTRGVISSVAAALAQARDGDTIVIQQGVYRERDLIVDKSVTVIGVDYPVIDGGGKGQIITVTAPNVVIKGLTVKGSGVSFVDDNAGILIEDAYGCVLENNRFVDNFFAVYIAKSYDCRIINNVITGSGSSETTSGNGIHLWYCRDIFIEGNTVSGHRDGIYFEFVEDSQIRNNRSFHNLRYGLHFMFSDRCVYEKNIFFENGAGVAVMYTNDIVMTHNEFLQNWGSSSYGLLLKEIRDSRVEENRFYQNTIGMYLESCNRVIVRRNDFVDNGWGIKIFASSLDNTFTHNNFIGNSFQVATNSRNNFSRFIENYWSNYSGYDLDHDGWGDVPFRPVSLFSIVVEKNPPTLVLMRSLLVDLLNLAERIIPTLTPETLVDEKPSMEQFP